MKRLENMKGFNVVAWVLVFLFAAFTAHLAMSLNDFTENVLPAYTIAQSI